MEIEEFKKQRAEFEKELTAKLVEFEERTGVKIFNFYIYRSEGTKVSASVQL